MAFSEHKYIEHQIVHFFISQLFPKPSFFVLNGSPCMVMSKQTKRKENHMYIKITTIRN